MLNVLCDIRTRALRPTSQHTTYSITITCWSPNNNRNWCTLWDREKHSWIYWTWIGINKAFQQWWEKITCFCTQKTELVLRHYLQEHSSDCLSCLTKCKAWQATVLVKAQLDLCKDAGCAIVIWKFPLQRSVEQCLVMVIIDAKSINTGITNKAIVVVYVKLWTVTHRIVRTIKNLIAIYHIIF